MKVVVLGKNGMLGHMAMSYLEKQDDVSVFGTDRSNLCANTFVQNNIKGIIGGKNQDALPIIKNADYVINCIGTIKPCIKEEDVDSVTNALMVNSLFPRYMANYCEKHNTRMIHVTTDCVYSGLDFVSKPENAYHDPQDVYGKSKSLGEPENCMVVRTSIIGPEKTNKRSLLEWVLSKVKGEEIYGFKNHIWNGVTTLELSRCLYDILDAELPDDRFNKLYHIHNFYNLSKFMLLKIINDVYNLGLTVKESRTEEPCCRTMSSTDTMCMLLEIPNITNQLKELREWTL
jgi:dTDP-4-dehydrorhamnose reductase